MSTLAIIIPYFQRQPGILRQALERVLDQAVPPGWDIRVLVTDDGSPHPADAEVEGLRFSPPFSLTLFKQENAGPAAARNRGLDESAPAADAIAFLDSDDIWPDNHLARAIGALEKGFDFYFTDNAREPVHDSYFDVHGPNTRAALAKADTEDGLAKIPPVLMTDLMIEEFPCQTSTVVYRTSLATDLRYDTRLRNCGEDLVFLVGLTTRAKNPCCDTLGKVVCGKGDNMYFGHFGWDSPNLMRIRKDSIRCHMHVDSMPGLSAAALSANRRSLALYRKNFSFQVLRRLIKHKGKIPQEVHDLRREDKNFWCWFPCSLAAVLVQYPLGIFKPL